MVVLYIFIAILMFGGLIFIHELGHYIFARIFKVEIKEFAIGMGPKLYSRTSEKTGIVYSLRLLPIGGYVSMEGEDDDSPSENALNKKPVWQRLIIMIAGAMMNIIAGVILTAIFVSTSNGIGSTVVARFEDNSISNSVLQAGDKIVRIDDTKVSTAHELSYAIMQSGDKEVDVTVIRNGEELVVQNVKFPTVNESGVTFGIMDFRVKAEKMTLGNIVKHTFHQSVTSIKMVWDSFVGLITGRYGFDQLSGPVGITNTIGETAKGENGGHNLLYLMSIIAMNLGVFNLIPFPALDGGRVVFLLVELIIRKPVKKEVEAYINFAGLALLMLLMVFVTFQDVLRLF